MSGLGLVLLLLKVDSIASLFTAFSLPHVEQNFAPSSILDPHEAQNSYIPPIFFYPSHIICCRIFGIPLKKIPV